MTMSALVFDLENLLDLLPAYDVDHARLQRVGMTSVNGYSHVPVRGSAMSRCRLTPSKEEN